MTKTKVITHRGLDPDRTPFHKESSLQAFTSHLRRGYGIEFDAQFASNGAMIAVHDKSLERLTNGADKRLISELHPSQIRTMDFDGDNLITIPVLLSLIQLKSRLGSLSAFHLKSINQTLERMAAVLDALNLIDPNKFIIFDAKVESARYLKKENSKLRLAASVAHPHDVKRYNDCVGGTLITIEDIINNKDLFDWAWLDEWDLMDEDGKEKTLYNSETFKALRDQGISIALVTPELHGTSPGLLGGEAHPDASPRERLNRRLAEIIALDPDAICTDHPDYVSSLIEQRQ